MQKHTGPNGSGSMPTRGALSIRNVTKVYDPEGVNMMAVDDCSMEIAPGEFCMIVGPSGCGKTTLLNAIAGFHSISTGEILLDGALLCGPGKPKADARRRQHRRVPAGRPVPVEDAR